ncbi:MAG: hypothetical protein FWF96_01805 [Kiritimatiellaeota bacterium]|nr:hypothetical protein [Kiritimatiellota bacterium]
MKKLLPALSVLIALSAGAQLLPLADFSRNTGGFGGAVQHRVEDGRGFAFLENAENSGQRWVACSKAVETPIPNEPEAFVFSVRSDNIGRIAVILDDATGQTFQHRVAFEANGKWQTLEIKDFAKASQTWGGANDKVFHPQVKSVGFTLEGNGLVAIDNVALRLSNKAFIPDLAWDLAPGHVFETVAQVAIPVRSARKSVEWELTDFWRDVVDKGTLTPVNGMATLKPAVKKQGYYLLRLGDQYVSFAVVPPFKPKARETPFGVMTHFAQHMTTDLLPLLDRIGISATRDEHYWKNVEQQKGVYTFSEKSNEWMADLKKTNMDLVLPMTFENPLHDGGKTPHTPEGCDAYGDYGVAMLKQYPQVKWLEVWNEYNGSWCDGPAATDRPRYYAQMVKHAYEKIKAFRPDVLVLGCAPVLLPPPYMEGIFKHGGLKHMDVVVIHPYRANPEGVEVEIAELQASIRKYNDGKDKPIWATEVGRHDHAEAEWEKGKKLYEFGRQRVARYLPRIYALCLSAGVEKIMWYLSRDYMEFTSMGLLRNVNEPMGKYAAAPAYPAFATLIRQLDGAKFVERADLGSKFTYALLFDTHEGPVWVCWAVQPAAIAFNANAPRKLVDIMGAESTLTPLNGQITLSLGEDVVYYRGNDKPVASPGLAVPADARCPVLATPVFNAGKNAAGLTLRTRGQALVLDANGAAALPLDTSAPKTECLEFELLRQGAVVARGTLSHETVESLAFLPKAVQAEGAATLFAQIENRLPGAPAYKLRGVEWKVNGQTIATREDLDLPAENILSLRASGGMRALAPYQRTDLEVTAKFENRADVTWKGSVAFNPCFKWTGDAFNNNRPQVDLDRHTQRWGANQNSGTRVEFGYDDDALHIEFSNTSKAILLGVASSDNAVWHVLRVDAGAVKGEYAAGAALFPAVAKTGTGYKLPWAALGLPKPQPGGTFRLAVAASDNRTFWEWGAGLLMGRTPEGFNVCRFVDPAVQDAPGAGFAVAPPEAKAAPLVPGRVLTDSESDYTKEQGGNNHWYGYFPEKKYAAGDFVEMTHVETMWGYNWAVKDGYQHMNISHGSAHPNEAGGFPVWAARRWKSDYEGKAQVTGLLHGNDDKSDGVGLRILVDGIQVASYLSGGKNYPKDVLFDVTVDLKPGTLVDFAFTPGPAANTFYDATSYNFKIRELK